MLQRMFLSLVFFGPAAFADPRSYYSDHRSRVEPNGYYFRSRGYGNDRLIGGREAVDLGVDLGVGADCGKVNFHQTLKATLSNMLDSQYFGDLGKNIIGSSPMLLTCYFSPTWCAIVKHSQVSANFLSQMRLNQCALVDKYVDTRAQDFYQERQQCIHKNIESEGGNLESAMQSCQNLWNTDQANWSGKKGAPRTNANRLIESSAKWAGLSGKDADKTIDLTKSLVGDTTVAQGSVDVDYGSKKKMQTPKEYLAELEHDFDERLCQRLVTQAAASRGLATVDRLVREEDLKKLNEDETDAVLDRQTIEALTLMPAAERSFACKKLADSLAMRSFTRNLTRSLDLLTVGSQNPNLPAHRKAELEEKRRSLRESVEVTLALRRERTDSVREVLERINDDGEKLRSEGTYDRLSSERSRLDNTRLKSSFFDCSDEQFCEGR